VESLLFFLFWFLSIKNKRTKKEDACFKSCAGGIAEAGRVLILAISQLPPVEHEPRRKSSTCHSQSLPPVQKERFFLPEKRKKNKTKDAKGDAKGKGKEPFQ
jgi:hypothetical protein